LAAKWLADFIRRHKQEGRGKVNDSIHMTVLRATPSKKLVPGPLEMLQCNTITFGNTETGEEQNYKGCLYTMWVESHILGLITRMRKMEK
jgi:hypothetical protein